MGFFTDIETFNTHTLNESNVINLNTGRENLINNIDSVIDLNLNSDTSIQHLVLIGPRGIGKSFLLRYFQIQTKNDEHIDYVLFPEEQFNINKPSQFLEEIIYHISGNKPKNNTSFNTVQSDEEWNKALKLFKEEVAKRQKEFKKYLLVIAIENIDILLEKVFKKKIDESRFRNLLNDTSNFMILGATLKNDFDSNYNKRLFKAFQKYEIEPWNDDDFISYFTKRWGMFKKEHPNEIDIKNINKKKNRLKAISQFSGGSPRIAIILTNLIFDESLLNTTQTLEKILENLTAYYVAIFEKVPEKSLILLDALVRNNENISQSKLAIIVNAKQSDISRAFKWLKDKNIIFGHRATNEKEILYSLADRMMSLLYHKRYIDTDISENKLTIYSDFLINFYEDKEIKDQALNYFRNNQEREGRAIANIIFPNKNISIDATNSLSKERIIEKLNQPQAIIDFENKLIIKINSKTIDGLIKDINIINKQFENNEYLKDILYAKYIEIAIFYTEQSEFNKSINYSKKIVMFSQEFGDKETEIIYLGILGWSYASLKEFSKSINYTRKAIELSQQLGNKESESLNLETLGLSYMGLQKFSKSIDCHKNAMKLSQQLGNKESESRNLKVLGWHYKNLQKFSKSIDYHKKSMKLYKELGDKENEAWNLGHIVENYLYFDESKAWEIFYKETNSDIEIHLLVKEMADAIVFTERWYGRSKGFIVATNIFDNLDNKLSPDEIYESIKSIFIQLLNMEISYDLLLDISSLAIDNYTEKENTIVDASIKCMEYKNASNKEKFLQSLHPDLSILVRSLIKESEL